MTGFIIFWALVLGFFFVTPIVYGIIRLAIKISDDNAYHRVKWGMGSAPVKVNGKWY